MNKTDNNLHEIENKAIVYEINGLSREIPHKNVLWYLRIGT